MGGLASQPYRHDSVNGYRTEWSSGGAAGSLARNRPRTASVHGSLAVYYWCMARTNVDVDDEACAAVMRRYHLATKRDAVNFALRSLASEPFTLEEARRMRGAGWDGDLDEMRGRSDDPR